MHSGMSLREAVEILTDVRSLDLWIQVGPHVQGRIDAVFTRDLPDAAIGSYDALHARLTAVYPEYRVWGGGARDDAPADGGFAGLAELLRAMALEGQVDERWRALERVSRAALDRPIVDVGDSAVSLRIPFLREASISPRFVARTSGPGDDPSRESWWPARESRSDIDTFLAGYLASSSSGRAPLVLLGQPGSGKSVFSRMLAATLGDGGYLPVLVPLREVPADGSIQDQVEAAIRRATGEDLKWPELVRSAAGAVPVVILDGFDELLQATGTHRTDYLQRAQDFQQREVDQGRSVAVLVTSRTAVANRVRYPAGTIVLKLLPSTRGRCVPGSRSGTRPIASTSGITTWPPSRRRWCCGRPIWRRSRCCS